MIARDADVDVVALSNAFAFGGMNAVLALRPVDREPWHKKTAPRKSGPIWTVEFCYSSNPRWDQLAF